MNVLERVRALSDRIKDLRAAQRHVTDAQQLEAKRRLLEHHRNVLESVVRPAILLVRNEIVEPNALPDAQRLLEAIETFSSSFRQDPSSLSKGRNFTTFERQCTNAIEAIGIAIKEAWHRKTHEEVPRTSSQFLDRLSQLRGMRSNVDDLRKAMENLKQFVPTPPVDEESLDLYRQLIKLAQGEVRSLNTDRFPKPAVDFCIAAQSEGAQLSMLTEEVRAWLEAQGMLEDLRYRFK